MAVLNESSNLDADASETFIGGRAEKVLLFEARALYKFSSFPMTRANGEITPWWSSVLPLGPGDDGLQGLLARSVRAQLNPKDMAQARAAVSKDWNGLANLLRASLLLPVWCWVGRCASQPIDNTRADLANVRFIGGAWQVYIPNLTKRHIRSVEV